jgi:hypothetical protein
MAFSIGKKFVDALNPFFSFERPKGQTQLPLDDRPKVLHHKSSINVPNL